MENTTSKPDAAWSRAQYHTDLVPVGDSQIEVVISGPPRPSPTTPAPLVIVEGGHGASLYQYVVAVRHIARFARVLSYSRSGYGKSIAGASQRPRTIPNLCEDLHDVLKAIGQEPPYVLVGHSMGGNIVRGYLNKYSGEVAGMVLVDSYCVYDPPPTDEGMFGAVMGPGGQETYRKVVGLEEHHKFTPAELALMLEIEANEKAEAASAAEGQNFEATTTEINEQQGLYRTEDGGWGFKEQQLGSKRLSVLAGSTTNDFTKLLVNAKEKGYGTEEQRNAFEEWARKWSQNEEQSRNCALSLSNDSRLTTAEGAAATHNIQMVAPELIAQEVRWVLGLEENTGPNKN